jgi:hypothetical protein
VPRAGPKMKHEQPAGPPMTLANMLELGVHHLIASCHQMDFPKVEMVLTSRPRRYRLTVPPSLLARADEVIE